MSIRALCMKLITATDCIAERASAAPGRRPFAATDRALEYKRRVINTGEMTGVVSSALDVKHCDKLAALCANVR